MNKMVIITPQTGDCTQQFIDAKTAAGIGGRVYVSAGTYTIAPVVLDVAGQLWECEHGVKLVRQAGFGGSTIQLAADDITFIGGEIDNTLEQSIGCCADISGNHCTMKGTVATLAAVYGIYSNAPNVTLIDCKVRNSGQIGIFCTTNVQAAGPTIKGCEVDRTGLTATISGGGIYVRGVSGGRFISPSITDCRTLLPSVSEDDAIGIEAWFSDRAKISGNHSTGGYMSISFGNMSDSVVTGNTCHDNYAYGIELAQNTYDCVVDGNTIDGAYHALHGVIVSAAGTPSTRNLISNNSIRRCNAGVSVFNSPHTLVSNNKLADNYEGVYLQSSQYSVVNGNTISGRSAGIGVRIETPMNTLIQGNAISGVVDGVKYESSADMFLNGNLMQGNTIAGGVINPLVLAINAPAHWSGHNRIVGNTGFYRAGRSADTLDVLNDLCVVWGGGAPEGLVSTGIGSVYYSIDGPMWKKVSGTGATGWQLL